jgi:glycerol uptake facilitator-like aquaporin
MLLDFPRALWRSISVTLPTLWRVTRQLFHEVTGALFVLFAGYGAVAAWKEWKQRPTVWLMAFAVAYALTMTVFAVGSFRRARRVR